MILPPYKQFLWTGVIGVALWRCAALFRPHPASSDPTVVRLTMAALGIWFLGWGLWAYGRSPTAPSFVLALFGLTAGVHWGGPLGLGPPALQNILLGAYLLIGVAASQALFLHLTLVFPPALANSHRRALFFVVYLPTIIGTFLFCSLLLLPQRTSILELLALLLPAGLLYSVAAAALWLYRLCVTSQQERRRTTWLVTSLFAGWLPPVLVSNGVVSLPGPDGLVNLTLALVPVSLAVALTRAPPVKDGEPSVALPSDDSEGRSRKAHTPSATVASNQASRLPRQEDGVQERP